MIEELGQALLGFPALLYQGEFMSEAGKVVEAEKGRNLSPQILHIRLRVVEAVVFFSLMLNLVQGFIANRSDKKLQSQLDGAKQESSAR